MVRVADVLREFADVLKLRMTIPKSAEAARIVCMVTNQRIQENKFYTFITEAYDRYMQKIFIYQSLRPKF